MSAISVLNGAVRGPRRFTLSRAVASCAAAMLAVSCASADSGTTGPAAVASSVVPTETLNAYLLDTGDKLRITVFGEPKFDGEYVVSGAGNISFPLIGNMPARGKTVEAFQQSIATALSGGYLRDPRVSAEMLNYRPYYILGEINKPGEYPFAIGLTVQQAVARAGGFSYRANTKRVFLKRVNDPVERPVSIKGDVNVVLMPGDTLRIGERFF
jgi:polysaccharide export outer membrane protein